MKNKIWLFCVLFFLIYVAPVLLIMMGLVLTPVPAYKALFYWLPIALVGTLAMAYWYKRQGEKAK